MDTDEREEFNKLGAVFMKIIKFGYFTILLMWYFLYKEIVVKEN